MSSPGLCMAANYPMKEYALDRNLQIVPLCILFQIFQTQLQVVCPTATEIQKAVTVSRLASKINYAVMKSPFNYVFIYLFYSFLMTPILICSTTSYTTTVSQAEWPSNARKVDINKSAFRYSFVKNYTFSQFLVIVSFNYLETPDSTVSIQTD